MNQRFFAWLLLFTSAFFLLTLYRERNANFEKEKQFKAMMQQEQDRAAAEDTKKRMAEAAKNANIDIPAEPALEYFSLGSMSPDDKRSIYLTLTNRGAAVDRIELVERDKQGAFRYKSLDNRSGYPGYLAFHKVAEGLKIFSVPLASPAQLATNTNPGQPDGLKVGDILVAVNGFNVSTLSEYHGAIKRFDAGETVRFTVLRGVDSQAHEFPSFGNEGAYEIKDFSADPRDFKKKDEPPKVENAPKEIAEAKVTAQEAAKTNEAPTDDNKEAASEETQVAAKPQTGEKFEFDVKLIEQPLDIVRNTNRYPAEQIEGNEQRASLLTTLASIDGVKIREGKRFIEGLDALLDRNWEAKPSKDGNGIDFELPLRAFLVACGVDADLTLVKSYRLKPFDATKPLDNYDFEFSSSIRNNSDKAHEVAIRQEGLSGLTLEGWWYSVKQSTNFGAAGARDVVVGRQGSSHELISRSTIETAAKNNETLKEVLIVGQGDGSATRNLRYFGVDSQYFVAALLPPKNTRNGLFDISSAAAIPLAHLQGDNQIQPYKDSAMNVSFYLDGPITEVTKDKALISNYRVFAGPKEPPILEGYGLGDVIYYGWSIFGMVAKPLSFILHAFYAFVGNYGIAIMMLTVLVRSCMFPFSWRASIMGQKMQELAPELKKINEQYKDDMQKRGTETQKLYKKYKLNPMASCLPMFIQLPIFIGLYRAVSTDVALRQQPFVRGWDWCSNLAGPDQFMLWPTWMPEYFSGKGSGWFGPYVNLLPIITCMLFIIQQKVLMPKATDEQTRMTQRMMMFMTVFMGIMFFKVPAGLCIYFITSSTWSLVERFLVKKFLPKAQLVPVEVADVPELPKPKPERRIQNIAGAKPPETLSELFQWLKTQWKGTEPGSEPPPTNPSRGNGSNRGNGPRRKKS